MCKTCTKLAHFFGIICTFGGGRSHRTTRQTVIECVDSIPFWHYRPSDFMPFWHIGMSENMPKSYVPFLVHCPIYGTLKITRIVYSIRHRAAAEVLLFSGVLAVSSVFIRHDSCSDFRIGRRESSDGVFYIEKFQKNFFQNTVDKSPPLLYNGIVGRGQEPRGRRKNYDRFGTIYQRM